MGKNLLIIFAIILVVGVPFALREPGEVLGPTDDVVIVITPHNESIRAEFSRAFRDWYFERYNRTVRIDWRNVGGTSEIVRYINSEFSNSFRNLWVRELNRRWTAAVQEAFTRDSGQTPEELEARAVFLDSNVSIGMDVFFGGGAYEFERAASAGFLVPWRTGEQLQELFADERFPQVFAGETFRDEEGRWIGAVLSSFGIVYNRFELARLGFEGSPTRWADLADRRFFGRVALADPTKSGSITKAFEMVVQEEMARAVQAAKERDQVEFLPQDAKAAALSEGWMSAMRLIQKISANARYFTDSASKPVVDVSNGDCAIGMAIDFYGRYQSEIVRTRGGGDRVGFVTPTGASTLSADPIGIFRGAPNPAVADAFVSFVMSVEGQRLWGFEAGTPGGPVRHSLRRNPVFRDFYKDPKRQFLSEPDIDPYAAVAGFIYRPEWTGPLFSPLRFIIRCAFIDAHDELRAAWAAIGAAEARGDYESAQAAKAILFDLSAVDMEAASGRIAEILRSRDKILEVQLARELTSHFRSLYRDAERRANRR